MELQIIIGGTLVLVLVVTLALVFMWMYHSKWRRKQLELSDIKERYLHDLLRANIDGTELERRRIAMELHDGIAADVSTALLYLRSYRSETERPEDDLQRIEDIIHLSAGNIRSLSHQMVPLMLDRKGLRAAMGQLTEQFGRSVSCPVTLSFEQESILSKEQALHLYRVVQELLQNIRKHGHPQSIHLQHQPAPGGEECFTLSYTGRPFSQADWDLAKQQSQGLGLKNIESRVKMIPGRMQIELVQATDPVLADHQITIYVERSSH